MKKIAIIGVIISLMLPSVPALAQEPGPMMVDILAVRPVGLAAIVFGTAVFIVSLPFSLASGSVDTVGRALVAKPFKFTFTRPIGDFGDTWAQITPPDEDP